MSIAFTDTSQQHDYQKDTNQQQKQQQFLMPAEWEDHAACVLLFPHNPCTYRLQWVEAEFVKVVQSIATIGQETVWILTKDEPQLHYVESLLLSKNKNDNNNNIHIAICPSNDTWIRDTGPTCCWEIVVVMDNDENQNNPSNKRLVGMDWGFNAYGGKEEGCYWPCTLDQQIAKNVCNLFQKNMTRHDVTDTIILEGGSIHTDGQGTLLVTQECLLNPNRNPQLSQLDIERILKPLLGISKIIWLPHGVDADEDTNGHVDNFCCFVKPGHVVLAWTDDQEKDLENYQRCRQAEQILHSTKDAQGRTIQVHHLQLPPPLYYTQEEVESLVVPNDSSGLARQVGEKMAASYVNFYIANQAIIVPQFGIVDTDANAVQVLQELFPNRQVIGVASREILIGGGNIHCITQQIPKHL